MAPDAYDRLTKKSYIAIGHVIGGGKVTNYCVGTGEKE